MFGYRVLPHKRSYLQQASSAISKHNKGTTALSPVDADNWTRLLQYRL